MVPGDLRANTPLKLKPPELLSKLNASYWFIPLLTALLGAAAAVLLLSAHSGLDLGSPRVAGPPGR